MRGAGYHIVDLSEKNLTEQDLRGLLDEMDLSADLMTRDNDYVVPDRWEPANRVSPNPEGALS
jgi:hypothetical protein